MAEGGGLLNRYRTSNPVGGSNPPPSATTAHLDFEVDRAIANLRRINAAALMLLVPARTGEGLASWYDWLRQRVTAARAAAFA